MDPLGLMKSSTKVSIFLPEQDSSRGLIHVLIGAKPHRRAQLQLPASTEVLFDFIE